MSNKPIIVKFTGPNPSIEVITIGHFTDNLVNDVTFEFNRYIGDIDLAQFYCMLHIENLGATLLQTKVSDSKLQAVLTVTTDITNFPGAHTASIKFVRDTGNLQYVWTTRNFDLIVERRIDLDKEIQHIDPTPLAGFIINLAANTARINDLEESKLDKPQEIQAGTFPKVTVNQYGLVTEGHNLSSEDIPPIPISRVSGLTDELEDIIETLAGEIDSKLADKADLVDGKVPLEQLPDIEITKQKVEAVLTGDITSHNHSTEIDNHNTSETAHNDIRQKVDEAKAIAEGKADATHTHTKSEIIDFPTIPTIPDIIVDNGNAESGKYISAIVVDATNKHKLNITKENLPTLKQSINEQSTHEDIPSAKAVEDRIEIFAGEIDSKLADKADLVDGKVPLEQLPDMEITKQKVEDVLTGDITSHNHLTEIGNHNTSETAHPFLKSKIDEAKAIAEGRSRARVFATKSELDTWLLDSENIASLLIGDHLYIEELDGPNYWWNGTTIVELGTQKVDLTEYAKKTELLTLGITENDAYRGDLGQIAYNHSQSAHAPSNAQKNSDITKAEIEAKLTGEISSHSHNLLYSPITHNHDDRYYTETEVDIKLGSKADVTHTHTKSEITDLDNDLQEQIDGIDDTLQNHESRIGELELFVENLEPNIIEEIEGALENKADLVDGKVPLEQLPDIEITKQKVEDVLIGDITSHNHITEIGNHNTSETAHNDIRQKVDEAKAIAEGRARARVFATETALDAWLAIPENVALLQIGDNFYIEETDKPNYWWNGTNKVELGTEKVDLIEYAKKTELLKLGTTSNDAYRGDLGHIAYNHSQSAHAPSNAQKNSDITKAEIEAKLTGEITSHSHALPSHNHDDKYYTESEIDTKLDGKANSSHTHTKSEITDFPTTMPPTAHNHTKSEITDFPTIPTIPDLELNDNTETSGKYISKIEVDGTNKHKLNITKKDLPQGFSGDYNDLTNKPSAFPPSVHEHDDKYYTKDEINNLLDNKVDEVTGKQLSTNDFTDELKTILEEAPTQEDLNAVIEIAEGKANARVFDNPDEAFDFLAINPTLVRIGDIFYIRQSQYPDYWYDGTTLQPFETELPNMDDYVPKSRTINGKPLSSNISLSAADVGALPSNYTPAYSDITGTKPPADAQKNSDITKAEIEAKLTGNITSHKHSYNNLDDKPTIPTKTSDLTNDSGFLTSLPTHNHDDRYYTESEIDTKLGGKANSSHTHTKSEITDFPTIPTVPTISNNIAEDAENTSKTTSPKAVKDYVDTVVGDFAAALMAIVGV